MATDYYGPFIPGKYPNPNQQQTTTTNAMANALGVSPITEVTGVRKWLNDQGYGNDQIDYSNGNVTIGGRNFIGATPQQQNDPSRGLMAGSTYAAPTALAKALGDFRATDYKNRSNSLLDAYSNRVQNAPSVVSSPSPFSYNANSDPIYQNALSQALANSKTAQNNAMVSLGSRGIGNSSIAVDRANQIQQRAVGDVQSNLLPQLVTQAYERYKYQNEQAAKAEQENYNRSMDSNRDLMGLSDIFANRSTGETALAQAIREQEEQRRQQNIKEANDLQEMFGIGIQPKDSGSALYAQVEGLPTLKAQTEQRQYFKELVDASDKYGEVLPELAQFIGVPAGTPMLNAVKEINNVAHQMGMLNVSRQNAATSARNADTSAYQASISARNADTTSRRLDFDMERERSKPQSEKINPNEIQSEVIGALDGMTPDQQAAFFAGERASIVRDLGIDGYNKLYNQFFDEYGEPRRR